MFGAMRRPALGREATPTDPEIEPETARIVGAVGGCSERRFALIAIPLAAATRAARGWGVRIRRATPGEARRRRGHQRYGRGGRSATGWLLMPCDGVWCGPAGGAGRALRGRRGPSRRAGEPCPSMPTPSSRPSSPLLLKRRTG